MRLSEQGQQKDPSWKLHSFCYPLVSHHPNGWQDSACLGWGHLSMGQCCRGLTKPVSLAVLPFPMNPHPSLKCEEAPPQSPHTNRGKPVWGTGFKVSFLPPTFLAFGAWNDTLHVIPDGPCARSPSCVCGCQETISEEQQSLYGCSYFGTIHRGRHLAALRLLEPKGTARCQRPLNEHGLEGHLGKAAKAGCGDRTLRPRVWSQSCHTAFRDWMNRQRNIGHVLSLHLLQPLAVIARAWLAYLRFSGELTTIFGQMDVSSAGYFSRSYHFSPWHFCHDLKSYYV